MPGTCELPRDVVGASRVARVVGRRRHGELHREYLPGGLLSTGPAPGTGHTLLGSVMSCGTRPGSRLLGASHHEAARPWDTAAGRTRLLNSRRVRPSFRRGWLWLWVL